MRAFIGLGSNLGNRWDHLRRAVAGLPGVRAVSQVYETEPVGGPAGQGAYLNAVVELETDLSPRELLRVAAGLERDAGRVRGERFGPRTLDVDVLLVGDLEVNEPDLTVPHPRIGERRFVTVPLGELAPELLRVEWAESATGKVVAAGKLDSDERHLPGPERGGRR